MLEYHILADRYHYKLIFTNFIWVLISGSDPTEAKPEMEI